MSAIARVVALKIKYTSARATADADIVAVEKRHLSIITPILDDISNAEAEVREYCLAHRAELFPDKKSRTISVADFGFELTPHRVATASRKITWKIVITRLLRLKWGRSYLRKVITPDKEALLADRTKLTPEQLTAAGIQFCQDEQFYIRPKLETAASTSAETK